jgi:hypothetical protein
MGATFLLASCGTKTTSVTSTTQENSKTVSPSYS